MNSQLEKLLQISERVLANAAYVIVPYTPESSLLR